MRQLVSFSYLKLQKSLIQLLIDHCSLSLGHKGLVTGSDTVDRTGAFRLMGPHCNLKIGKRLKCYYMKEDVPKANKHLEKMLHLSHIREISQGNNNNK